MGIPRTLNILSKMSLIPLALGVALWSSTMDDVQFVLILTETDTLNRSTVRNYHFAEVLASA
jgi:hypothetical protein